MYISVGVSMKYIFMSVYETVYVSMRACVRVSLSAWVHIFQLQFNQKLHQNSSTVVIAKGRPI